MRNRLSVTILKKKEFKRASTVEKVMKPIQQEAPESDYHDARDVYQYLSAGRRS